ncbi:MAG: hypothetical protein IE931_03335 [Sphingobacteriales bacterium]|nr:hypothetical protein [Sphingobacteriales bacterium]
MIDGRSYLAEVFDLAFGVKSPVFIPYTYDLGKLFENDQKFTLPEEKTPGVATYNGPELKPDDITGPLSGLGTPIVYPFTLKGGIYKVFNKDGDLVDFKLADFMMPAATLITFTRAKIITKTPVLGANGSVKELYSFDDWKIRIRGICLDDSSRKTAKTAKAQKEELLKWEQVAGSINIIGDLFFEKNILALTINSANFDQLEGKPNVIPFELECEGDERLELLL